MSITVHPALRPTISDLGIYLPSQEAPMSRLSVPSVSSLARAAGPNMAKGALPTACQRSAPPAHVAFLVPNMQEAMFPRGIRGEGTGMPPSGSAVLQLLTPVKQVAITYKNTTHTGF